MGLLDGLKNDIMEFISDEPEWKGYRFEKYVENLFPERTFQLVDKTHTFQDNSKRYVESSMNYDFIFRHKPTKNEFAVEAKYRSGLGKKGMLSWSNPQQLRRYQDFATNQRIPYFVIIGLGGEDNAPDKMFCLPLKEAKYPDLYSSVYRNFERNPKTDFFWKDGILK